MPKNTGKEQGKVGKNNPPEKTKFKKGKSGNPKGRPKGSLNYATVLNKLLLAKLTPEALAKIKPSKRLQAVIPNEPDGEELYWAGMLALSLGGNGKAIETIAHYAYGKPPTTLKTDEPLEVEFVIRNANPFEKK